MPTTIEHRIALPLSTVHVAREYEGPGTDLTQVGYPLCSRSRPIRAALFRVFGFVATPTRERADCPDCLKEKNDAE